MKIILEIARIQLARFFYSPIAWLILVLLFIQTGYTYTELLDFFEQQQRKNFPWLSLTTKIFTEDVGVGQGLFYTLSKNLYLYLPLLTMGLLSAEISTGSIKLLYSSPLSIKQLILGKFLSIVAFSVLFIISLWLFVTSGVFIVQDLDVIHIICASIGVLLLASAYASIGLFISSFSSYQIVVALATFAILGSLNLVAELGQSIPYLKDMMFWLSMTDRANDFIEGLFKSQNLIYFLLIIVAFLSLTFLKLEFNRKSTGWKSQLFAYSFLTVLVVIIAYFSSIPTLRWYYDMTEVDQNTISKKSQKVIESLGDSPLIMKIYANILDHNVASASPNNQNVDKRMFEEYQRFKPDFQFEYIYFYDTVENRTLYADNKGLSIKELAQKLAKSYGLDFGEVLSPSEIKELVDLADEENQYTRHLIYDGRSTFLRMFDGMVHYPREQEFVAAVKTLVNKGPFQVAFLTGHDERNFQSIQDQDYKIALDQRHRNISSLRNHGVEFFDVSLKYSGVPDSTKVLVVADPKIAFDHNEVKRILEYIDQGGNLLILVEPNKAYTIDLVLKRLGVQQIPGQLSTKHEEGYDKNMILAQYAKDTTLFPNYWLNEFTLRYKFPVTMPSVSGWLYDSISNGFSVKPFLIAENVHSDSLNTTFKKVSTALTLWRKNHQFEQRILLVGDADFMSNKELTRGNIRSTNDKGLVPFIFNWLSNGEFPINVEKSKGNDNHLNLGKEDGKTVRMLKIIYTILFPCFLLLLGGTLLVTRKRK